VVFLCSKVNVGVVGLGRIGRLYANILRLHVPEARLVAVVDKICDLARSVAKEVGAKYYTSLLDMLEKESDLDAVIIATPTYLHRDMVILAADYGKHIFCEKPLSLSHIDAIDILKKVRSAGVILQVGYMRRFDKLYRYAYEIIREDLGHILVINFVTCDPGVPPKWVFNRRLSGGIFLDMLSHEIDLAMYFADSKVKTIYASGTVRYYDEARSGGDLDTAFISITFENDAVCNIYGCRGATSEYILVTNIFGKEGQIQINYNNLKCSSGHSVYVAVLDDYNEPWFIRRFYNAYISEIKHFIDCIVKGANPIVGWEEGKKVIDISEAAWKSVEKKNPIYFQQT